MKQKLINIGTILIINFHIYYFYKCHKLLENIEKVY
jgi:hypothetical protein